MSANEIAERLAAACWVQFGSAGGEAINALDVDQVRYRSMVGFRNRIITTTNGATVPCFILPLDRVFSRKQTSVFAQRIGTVGALEDNRDSYPLISAPTNGQPDLFFQPLKLSWLGADLRNPTYMPFGLAPGGDVPAGEDMDLFDAIAVLLPATDFALSGDVCVAVFQHPKLEVSALEVDEVLPAELPVDPILALAPVAWFRADTWIDVGEDAHGFQGRVGTEGNFLGEGAPAPAPNAVLNNQMALTWNGTDGGGAGLVSTMPAAFWDFLATEDFTVYIVGYPDDMDEQTFLTNSADEINVLSDPANDAWITNFGVAGADATFSTGGWAGAVGAKQLMILRVDSLAGQPITVSATSAGENGGSFIQPPSGSVTATLAAFTGGAGILHAAEYLFFNRAVDAPDDAIVQAYLLERYDGF